MRRIKALAASAAVGALALAGTAVPAGAQQQSGLVNVNIEDTTIQVPIGIAANICNVPVAVLAQDVRTGDAECDAAVDQEL